VGCSPRLHLTCPPPSACTMHAGTRLRAPAATLHHIMAQPCSPLHPARSFFQLRHRVALCQGQEVLAPDLCVSLHGGSHLLVASHTERLSLSPGVQVAAAAVTGNAGGSPPTCDAYETVTFHVVRGLAAAPAGEEPQSAPASAPWHAAAVRH